MSNLIVVGSGIKFYSHLTVEAIAHIEKADKVLYLVNEPAMEKWICESNRCVESLYSFYEKHSVRSACYTAITNHIIKTLNMNSHVCVVLYGHPVIFANPALDAVVKAKQEGHYAEILPGISAEACLFADLVINPGNNGCQSFEATDFLIYSRHFSSSSHLILWQIGMIGVTEFPPVQNNSNGIKILMQYLSQQYELSNEVVLYEAAQYPKFKPRIEKVKLADLINTPISAITTLYIAPSTKNKLNETMVHDLGMKLTS